MKKVKNQQLKTQAQQFMSQGRLAEARPLMMQFCKRNPGDPEGWCMLGAIHGQTGAYAKAEACARKALKVAPAFQYAFMVLGNALQAQDKYPEAIKTYRRAMRVTGSSPGLLINMGLHSRKPRGTRKLNPVFAKPWKARRAILWRSTTTPFC